MVDKLKKLRKCRTVYTLSSKDSKIQVFCADDELLGINRDWLKPEYLVQENKTEEEIMREFAIDFLIRALELPEYVSKYINFKIIPHERIDL